MFGHGTKEGTDFWNIAKVIAVLLILAVIFVGIISIAESFADSANTATTEETLNPGSAKSEIGTGVNASKTEVKTAEKDIVRVTLAGGIQYIDISPVECSSNLKTTSVDMKKFDIYSVKSEGVWFSEIPTNDEELGNVGLVLAVAAIKKENVANFHLEIDDITLNNLRIVEDDRERCCNLVIDADVPYLEVLYHTWMDGKGPIKSAKTTTTNKDILLFKDIESEGLKQRNLICIEIAYNRPSINPNL